VNKTNEEMFMKRLAVVFSFILLLLPITSYAQDALEVGTPVRGEITNAEFEVEYTFSGAADSVVIIELLAEDDEGFMNELYGQVILVNSSGEVVVDTADNFTFGDATLVTQLPADDEYTIIATREDGRAGESEGEFTLILNVPDVLGFGDVAEGAASSEGEALYYVVEAEEDFELSYNKNAGDFDPEILISTVADNNSDTEDYASINGSITNVSIGDIPAGLYIIEVDDALFSFYWDEVTADFTLSVEPALR
jgi:hypothetical protein